MRKLKWGKLLKQLAQGHGSSEWQTWSPTQAFYLQFAHLPTCAKRCPKMRRTGTSNSPKNILGTNSPDGRKSRPWDALSSLVIVPSRTPANATQMLSKLEKLFQFLKYRKMITEESDFPPFQRLPNFNGEGNTSHQQGWLDGLQKQPNNPLEATRITKSSLAAKKSDPHQAKSTGSNRWKQQPHTGSSRDMVKGKGGALGLYVAEILLGRAPRQNHSY